MSANRFLCATMGCQRTTGRILFLLLRTMFLCIVMFSMTSNTSKINSTNEALLYLSSYGYLRSTRANSNSGLLDEKAWTIAIKEFQAFAGLNVTGELDNATKELMSAPRCGVKDKVGYGFESRTKRYALQGSRWKVKDLTYKISKYPSRLSKPSVDKVIAQAFQVWSDYTDLTFTPKSGQVHIEIRFETGEHGDGDPFDGPGGTLAHAYFPVYGGDAHFDDSEGWTINSYRGTNLFQVAAHEFGHSLGLSHSDVRSALMAPFYRGYEPSFSLDSDDISGIQALYGKKTHKTSIDDNDDYDPDNSVKNVNKRPPYPVEYPELCKGPKIDTIFNSAEGVTYVFKGDYYYKLTKVGVESGYPKLISKSWIGLPGHIDAAFTYKNGKTYFFKGSKYWRYTGKIVDGAYPKEISEGFTGIPDNVDAALVWTGNGKIYFYKGSKFWRFDPSQRPPVRSTYPKPISNWEGVPNNLDAALHYTNGYTYFFKDGTYYRFNDRAFSVDTANPKFPRPTSYWWFGCKSANKGTMNNLHWQSEYRELSERDDDHVSDLILDAADSDDRTFPPRDIDNFERSSAAHHSNIMALLLTLVTLSVMRYLSV